MSQFLAGWAEVALTPDQKVRLCGQFAERVSEYVETPVFATSLAIEADGDCAVLCSCDLVSIDLNLLQLVRERLAEKAPDFDARKIIISATHTHTSVQYAGKNNDAGNSLKTLMKYLPEDAVYEEMMAGDDSVMSDADALLFLADRISQSAAEAWNSRRPALFSNQFGRAAIGMNRRGELEEHFKRLEGIWNAHSVYIDNAHE